jgi:hypothetical protein
MNDKCVIEHKKEIAKCLGRPLIQTNPNEVLKFSFLLKSSDLFLHFFIWFFFFGVLKDFVNLGYMVR